MLILLLLLFLQAPTSASIEGVVTKTGTNEPVPRASVIVTRIQGQLNDVQTVIADDTGRFVVRNLAPGSHRVFAIRDGFMRAEFGQLKPTRPGMPIVLTAGETRRNSNLSLSPLAVISGRVIDAEGKPVPNAFVRASQARYSLGKRTLEMVQRLQTNDLGEFRFFNLQPGAYYVMALPAHAPLIEGDSYVIPSTSAPENRGGEPDIRLAGPEALADGVVSAAAFREEAFKTVYYPGTTDPASALPINLQPGAVFSGVELKTAKTSTVRIRGRAINGLTGQPEQSIWVSLSMPGYGTDERASSSHNDDGTFDFRAAPGTYVLTAENGIRLAAHALGLWASMTIEVRNKDIEGINLDLRPGFSMKGRIVIEGRPAGGNDPDYQRILLNLVGDNPVAGVRPEQDGTFIVNNNPLRTGSYRLHVLTLPPRFYIKSARLGPKEVLDSGFTLDAEPADTLEILVSPNSATVSATALDERQRPAPGITVVLVPDAKRRGQTYLYRNALTDAAGHVNFEGVAPGDYKLFAWEDIATDGWQDPEVIRVNDSRGVALHVNEDSRESVSVRVIQ